MMRRLTRMLREARESARRGGRRRIGRLADILVLLIQLRNGCRVGEAIEALRRFCETGEREVEVRIEKKRVPQTRTVVLPRSVTREDLRLVSPVVGGLNRHRVKAFARYHLGVNTHSMRYAFVTRLAERGVSAQLIAKILGHSDLSHLLRYTQKAKALEVLRGVGG